MTPTLLGRWQIRIFLLSTVGLVISLLVGGTIGKGDFSLPLLGLLYVLIVGCILDVLYQYILSFRWDADWPTSFQVVAGVLEGLLVWFLLPSSKVLAIFLWQYGSIWLMMFILTQGPLRLLWPKCRYQGGEWLRTSARRPQSVPSRPPSVSAPVQAPRDTLPHGSRQGASPTPP